MEKDWYQKNWTLDIQNISGRGDLCFINGIVEEADLTDAELIIIEHCGHVCNIDQSRQFNDIISELLDIE